MKQSWLLGAVLVLVGTSATRADEPKAGLVKAPGTGGFVHVVIFTLKKDAPKEAVAEVVADCHAMLSKIPSVRAVKAGRPSEKVAEKFVKTNYHLALVVVVDDFAGLKAYHEHPQHVAFVKKHGKRFDLDKLTVYDFLNQPK
jgi:Stress responsive A/B Barrel Domain